MPADADRERHAHAAMLKSVIANSQSLIYVKDLEGRYLLANKAFEQVFGVSEQALLGQTDVYLDRELAPVWRANDVRARKALMNSTSGLRLPTAATCTSRSSSRCSTGTASCTPPAGSPWT